MRAVLLAMLVVAACSVLAACSDNDDIPAPRVSNVSPATAMPGAVVTVNGAYLCQQPDTGSDEDPLACDEVDGIVWFGTVPGVTTLWTDSAVTVEVPSAMAGSLQLSITATGRSSNSISFTIE